MNDKKDIAAACTCGQLSITIKSAPILQLVCHCSDCRGIVKRPFSQVAFFRASACEFRGASRSTTMKGGSGHNKTYFFCDACDTCLYATVGALDGAVGVVVQHLTSFDFNPLFHVWTSEKATETKLPKMAMKFSKAPPGFMRSALLWSLKYLPKLTSG